MASRLPAERHAATSDDAPRPRDPLKCRRAGAFHDVSSWGQDGSQDVLQRAGGMAYVLLRIERQLMSNVPWRPILAAALGGSAGLVYYLLIGCDSG